MNCFIGHGEVFLNKTIFYNYKKIFTFKNTFSIDMETPYSENSPVLNSFVVETIVKNASLNPL